MNMLKITIKRSTIRKCFVIFCILFIAYIRFHYYWNDEIAMRGDTPSYVNYDFSIRAWGLRPPLYPALIAVCRMLWGGSTYLKVVCVVQILVSAMAVYAVFKSTMIATKNLYISGVIMLLYGCSTGPLKYDMTILTESLAISFSAFFLLSIVKYVDSCSCKDGMIAVLIAFLATCEKVTLAVYIGVILVLLILQFFIYPAKRKDILKVGGAVGVVSILCLVYATICWMNYGTFSLTNLGPRHSLVPCIVTESYKNYPGEELVSKIEAIIESREAEGEDIRNWNTTTPIMELFGDTERERNIRVAEFTSYCKRLDRKAYAQYLFNMIHEYKGQYYAGGNIESNSWISAKTWVLTQKFGFVRIDTGFWVILLSTVATVLLWILGKKCPWYFLGTAGTLLIIEVSVFTQSYADFRRLTVYTQPFIYFGFAILFQLLGQQIRKLVLYGRDHVRIELQ